MWASTRTHLQGHTVSPTSSSSLQKGAVGRVPPLLPSSLPLPDFPCASWSASFVSTLSTVCLHQNNEFYWLCNQWLWHLARQLFDLVINLGVSHSQQYCSVFNSSSLGCGTHLDFVDSYINCFLEITQTNISIQLSTVGNIYFCNIRCVSQFPSIISDFVKSTQQIVVAMLLKQGSMDHVGLTNRFPTSYSINRIQICLGRAEMLEQSLLKYKHI